MNIRAPLTFLVLTPLVVAAQNSAPTAQTIVDNIPPARDAAYPGVLTQTVDATDVTHGIFRITETIPAAPGPLVLLYPKWLPGHHSDNGPIPNLAGLKIAANGQPVEWKRDPVDVYAFPLDVPAGATSVEAVYQFLAPTAENQGRIVTTPDMLNLQWNTTTLYPAGYYVRQIPIEASVKLPDGWKLASALEIASQDGAVTHFKQVSVDTLIDSPLMAGANVRVEQLSPDVRLDIIADQPEQLAATDEQIKAHKTLVEQAVKLYGAQHYDHYDFLLALSDRQSGIGLEHHRSSEDGVTGNYFTGWKDDCSHRDLLPHEYTHSWCGKFRRPADLWTPDYRAPMQDSLLWVYEGQTEFWGIVLGARSGLLTKQETLDSWAALAARLDLDAGRKWRPLEDTTDDPIIAQRRPKPWRSYQRSEDYYREGALVWLDADGWIREKSNGAKSMDDFARAFFGVRDRDWGELTFTFDDIVNTLNQVEPSDWATFLHDRLDKVTESAPLDGFTRGGYRLAFTNAPSDYFKSLEKTRKITDLTFSGGFVLGKEGEVTEVTWDGPAFNAGLTVGSKIVAVNGRALETDQLKTWIKAKKSPLSLLIRTGDVFRTVELNYDGGLRYPTLERTDAGPSSLDALLAPKP